MVESRGPSSKIEQPGLSVSMEPTLHIASLRYFAPAGDFGARVADAVAHPLPAVCKAVNARCLPSGENMWLAWRNPTETLLIAASPAAFQTIRHKVSGAQDGHFIDQTGGIAILRAGGPCVADLWSRLGTSVTVAQGESKRCLLADVPVMAVRVDEDQTWLLVERIYQEHLMQWIRETAADLASSEVRRAY